MAIIIKLIRLLIIKPIKIKLPILSRTDPKVMTSDEVPLELRNQYKVIAKLNINSSSRPSDRPRQVHSFRTRPRMKKCLCLMTLSKSSILNLCSRPPLETLMKPLSKNKDRVGSRVMRR